MLVYLVTNTVNNKVYVGKFVGEHVKDRWQRHLRDAVRGDCYLYRAMRKYGAQTFEISVLSSGIGSKQDLADQEKMYIAQYRANIAGYGYNMTPGGDGGCGLTESARKKVLSSIHSKLSILFKRISSISFLCEHYVLQS
jgi:group I intron endonuclease